VLVVLLAAAADVLLVANRVRHVEVRMPAAAAGTTYLLVGSDSRSTLPDGMSRYDIGDEAQVPGARADVVLVVHVRPDGTSTTFSVPRDLLVATATGHLHRVALTLNDGGPQELVDALCRSLGIRTSHLVMVEFAGFTEVVDAAGGVPVVLDAAVRDRWSGLDLAAGPHTLTGVQALALVRSRHSERQVGGQWVALTEQQGADQRTHWAGEVFATLRDAADRARTDPFLAQRLAWAGSGALTTDSATGVLDLAAMARAAGDVIDLPVAPIPGGTWAVQQSDATTAALAAAGITQDCTPG